MDARGTGQGEAPQPPALLCMALLPQGYLQVSDAEAVRLSATDRCWRVVMDRRLLERTVEVAKRTKAFDWKKLPATLRLAVDSRPLEGAGRVEDSYEVRSTRRISNRYRCLLLLALVSACSGTRRYYSHAELSKLEGNQALRVVPGPWPEVPSVLLTSLTDTASVPDDLVLPTLKALMSLPGAVGTCNKSTGRPLWSATEYCVAIYRTPEDWRVSWPVQNNVGFNDGCRPPYGGVDDTDFGRDVPVFGYAHNHPCGTDVSGQDLIVWPLAKSEGKWVVVEYAITPGGRLARDAQGQPVAAWGWLATGPQSAPRFYKWNRAGDVFHWDGERRRWRFQANCQPQPPSTFRPEGAPPVCAPKR